MKAMRPPWRRVSSSREDGGSFQLLDIALQTHPAEMVVKHGIARGDEGNDGTCSEAA